MNWKPLLFIFCFLSNPLYITEVKEGHYFGLMEMMGAAQNHTNHQMYLYPPEQLDDGWYYTKYSGYFATTQPINFKQLRYISHIQIEEEDITPVHLNQIVPTTQPSDVDTAPLLNQITQMELQSGSARLQLRSLYNRVEDPELKKLVQTAIDQVTAVENRSKQLRTLTENLE